MTMVHFAKYEGAGNDFVMIDNRGGAFVADEKIVAALCDRRFGIGADGLILLENDELVQFRMRYFNADGGEATMCGNGGRCIVLFAHHLGIGDDSKEFMAVDGVHHAEVVSHDGEAGIIALRMADVDGITAVGDGYVTDTGSPHYVEFVDNVDEMDVVTRGRDLRYRPEFEQYGGVNVNFVQVTGGDSIRMRTYERGVEDETLACGTGATASAIVTNAVRSGDAVRFDVAVRGGRLEVKFDASPQREYSDVVLTGPARRVFEGDFCVENF